jgi:glutaredoxin
MKKITVYIQDYCAPCHRIKKQLPAVEQKTGIEVEYVDITGKWEIAEQVGFRTTPAVYLDDDGILTELQERMAVGLIREVEQYV